MMKMRVAFLWLVFFLLSGFQSGWVPGFRPGFQFVSGGSAFWTPLNLGAQLVAWWDPTQGVTLNGSGVSSWADRVGGFALTQATASQQPVFSVTARNGKPGISCLASSSQLITASGIGTLPTGAVTIATAAYVNGVPSGIQRIASYGSANSNGAGRMIAVGNTSPYYSAADILGSRLFSTAAWSNVDSFVIASFPSGTGALTVSITADGGTTTTGTLTLSGVDPTATSICASSGGGSLFNGSVQQVFVISGLISTSDRKKLEGWESWNDGKAGANLPASHPYATRPPYVSDP